MKLRVAEGSWQKDLGKVDRNKLYCNIGGLDVCPTFLLALAQRTGLGSNGKSICKLDLMHDSKANQHIYIEDNFLRAFKALVSAVSSHLLEKGPHSKNFAAPLVQKPLRFRFDLGIFAGKPVQKSIPP